jgi:hypothetical protein
LVTFFAPAKKVTRAPQASEMLLRLTSKAKSLDSGLTSFAVVELLAGMTSFRARAEFQLSLE